MSKKSEAGKEVIQLPTEDESPVDADFKIKDANDLGLILSWKLPNHLKNPTIDLYMSYDGENYVKGFSNVTTPYVLQKSGEPGSMIFLCIKINDKHFSNVEEADFSVKCLDAPVLRCYDNFEFPGEGSFHVKTCSAPKAGKRIFLQWFPVEHVSYYMVYGAKGNEVTKDKFTKRWKVPATDYYFESEVMSDGECWSVFVCAADKHGIESIPSKTYSTC